MSKKILSVFSILFLSSILVLSCSNTNKTGSGDNNGSNNESGTGDGSTGGTTQTPQGIAKYAGTWAAIFADNDIYSIIIGNDGTVTIKDGTNNPKQATDIVESGNTYTMTVQYSSTVDPSMITVTFESNNSGTIDDDIFGSGTISKIINE